MNSFQEIPKILLIDFEDEDNLQFKSKGYNYSTGSLGKQVEVPNTSRNNKHICLLNQDLPDNLHEFDIIIVNLQNVKTIPYDPVDHRHGFVKGKEAHAIRVSYPQTIYDPRPFSGSLLAKDLGSFINKTALIIVFASRKEEASYDFIRITEDGIESLHESTYNTYSFLGSTRFTSCTNISGNKTEVAIDIDADFKRLLSEYNMEASYKIAFDHDTEWDNELKKQVKRTTFIPLMFSEDKRIIAYSDYDEKTSIFVFPGINNKGEFLIKFFENILPAKFPVLFPYSNRFSWLSNAEYKLPNEESLGVKRQQLEREFSQKLEELDKETDDNCKEYSWLHELLTQTGPSLVKAVAHYLYWLGFPKVINVDEEGKEPKAEDLRVELDNTFLVVEVKGIAGTSTDGDCAQISKVRYRKGKERGTYNVFGLYIVNHQLYLPPNNRTNPPFSIQQIQDAKNDERGLLTTYDLFRLYFHIEDNFITKEDARAALFKFGFVSFTPSNAKLIGSPIEIHYGGSVIIVDVGNSPISVGNDLIVEEPYHFRRVKTIEIQVNGESVIHAEKGTIGIKLDAPLNKTSQIWLPHVTN